MENKKRLTLCLIAILLTVVILLGVSYALWVNTHEQTNYNLIESGCFDIEFSETGQDILLENAFPMTDEEGLELEPYSFKLENKCQTIAKYFVRIEKANISTLSPYDIKVAFGESISVLSTKNSYVSSALNRPGVTIDGIYVVHAGYLLPGAEVEHEIREWISANATQTNAKNKILENYVTIEATAVNPKSGFSDSLVANYGGRAAIEEKGDPNFSTISPSIASYYETTDPDIYLYFDSNNNRALGTGYTFNPNTGLFALTGYTTNQSYSTGSIGKYTCGDNSYSNCERVYKVEVVSGNTAEYGTMYNKELLALDYSEEGMYATQDDYGVSYYYRGTPSLNNNVIFAGFQWRIVRINGDDSVRLIYNGPAEEYYKNGKIIGSAPLISASGKFNLQTNDNAYVGYMYGTPNSPTYAATHTNTNNSNLKVNADAWYVAEIVGSEYEQYIVDNSFCGDRSIHTGLGYQQNTTYYAAHNRLYNLHAPTMKCVQQSDRYTVSDTTIGNGALEYPIGHLSADEIVMAGGSVEELNPRYYLSLSYLLETYWLMTPCSYVGSASVFASCFSDAAVESTNTNDHIPNVRPVINITSDVRFVGTGSATDPYIIVP